MTDGRHLGGLLPGGGTEQEMPRGGRKLSQPRLGIRFQMYTNIHWKSTYLYYVKCQVLSASLMLTALGRFLSVS